VNLKCTHPFDELSWNAPIYLDGCINNLKVKKIDKRDV
jgi:hypothetical protein